MMPNRKRRPNRRVTRRPRRGAGRSQRIANRRNLIRVALKTKSTSKDLYYIPLTDLVPVSEPLPETDEQLHKVSCNVTIVTNNNVTGCTYQMGIAGPWAYDENVGASDFLPLTSPKMLKSNRPTRCIIGIPEPTRHVKGVLTDTNFIAIQIYPVCPGQVDSATVIVSTNSIFKLAIKEPDPIDVGVINSLQSMFVHDTPIGPPANQLSIPSQLIARGLTYTTPDTDFPFKYNAPLDLARSYTITGSGSHTMAGVFRFDAGRDIQTQYDNQNFNGNIASTPH